MKIEESPDGLTTGLSKPKQHAFFSKSGQHMSISHQELGRFLC